MIDLEKIGKICNDILSIDNIRFCALIDSSGELIQGGVRHGITPFETDENQKKMFQELATRITKRKNFDQNFGRVKYSASRRENVVMMSFPLNEHIIMITADPGVNIDRLAWKVIQLFGSQWSEFFGK